MYSSIDHCIWNAVVAQHCDFSTDVIHRISKISAFDNELQCQRKHVLSFFQVYKISKRVGPSHDWTILMSTYFNFYAFEKNHPTDIFF